MSRNPLNSVMGLFSRDIGIDLGTANTLVLVRGKGIVINEPSVVAIDAKTKRPLAVGADAKRMVGRTPANIVAVRPLKDGVISDFDVTELMLHYFIRKVHERCMIVDIGGGTTEVAVISLGGIVVARSIRIAGDEMDMNIAQYMRQKHNLLIGDRMAEEVKIAGGNAYYGLNGRTPDQRVVVRGRDLVTGLPAELEVNGDEIREAISLSVNSIVDAVTDTIEETPPELVADMMARGITLAGGGSLLPGLADLLSRRTKMQVHLAEDPLGCVVRGTGKVLNELEVLRKVLVDQHSGRPLYRR